MDVAAFCRHSRVLIVAGKGGVGKTTVSATLATMAANQGLSVLIVELEGKAGLGASFGRPEPLTYDEVVLSGGDGSQADIRARTLTPDDALIEYLVDHGLRRVSKRLVSSGAIDVVATAAPGIRDILVLGKVKQLERSGAADLIIVDAPAAGHTLTFLSSAQGFLDAVRVGPIRVQAGDVLELLTDPERCQVMFVTLPEETPVNELVETAFKLEDRVGVTLGPVVVNGLYPTVEDLEDAAGELSAGSPEDLASVASQDEFEALLAAARFRLSRQRLQATQMERLEEALPLAQLRTPYVFTTEIGPAEIGTLASSLTAGVEKL